jgi:hypothetical protein
MRSAREILSVSFSASLFNKQSQAVLSDHLIQRISSRIQLLEELTERTGEMTVSVSGNIDPSLLLAKFRSVGVKNEFPMHGVGMFTRKELRILTYSMTSQQSNVAAIISSPSEVNILLQHLVHSWRDGFIFGLVYTYFLKWDEMKFEVRKILDVFLTQKLSEYDGDRMILKALKKNISFLNASNGDVLLGSTISIKDHEIVDAPGFLSLPKNWFSYPYFSKVIDAYFERSKSRLNETCDRVLSALRQHNRIETTKRTLSKIIILADANEFAGLQDLVKRFAFEKIGDPGNSANWQQFANCTSSEAENIKKARAILNEWITRQFINVFFEKCINDFRRKRFWLKYSKMISQFRIVGSMHVNSILKNDTRIRDYVAARFSKTNSTSDGNAALMFIIKNHLFIEFSDDGAFYAYKLSNKNAPSIDDTYFQSTSKLKTPSMKWLAYRTGVYINEMHDEGRLGHNDGDLQWESVADFWMKNKADINV